MLSEQENERITRVGPGTPMGEMLRRYWHPVATVEDLEREKVLSIRRLGEDLVLYKSESGEYGLIQERCPHRSASLAYGIPHEDGIRCPYHGWLFNAEGQCLEQPFDDIANDQNTFKDKVKVDAYPVEVQGGMVWAYMGPSEKKPLLPHWEGFVKEGVSRSIGITHLPCNWLQCMENSLDPVHFEWLHANLINFVAKKRGEEPMMFPARHERIDFDVFEYGIYKRRLLVGDDPETSPDWLVGHPVLFPNILAFKSPSGGHFQIRVPIDDYNTWHLLYSTSFPKDGEEPATRSHEVPYKHDNGRLVIETVIGTDMMAWVTQGPVTPRHLEALGVSDRGIILYRNILSDGIDAVARGEDPPGLVRDAALNEPFLTYRGEEDLGQARQAFQRRESSGPREQIPVPAGG
jgi:5,5'-dehydrodivanillate O-demethylase